jgi:hypothetical protein
MNNHISIIIDLITLFITLTGLFVAYCQLIIPLNQDRAQHKKLQNFFEATLIMQLWQNMNFISSIERSYNKNLNIKDHYIHEPKFSPSIAILEKLIDIQMLSNWNISDLDKQLILGIYQDTIEVKNLFNKWKINLSQYDNLTTEENINRYKKDSVLLLEYIDIVMRNSVQLFCNLLENKTLIKSIPNERIRHKFLDVSNEIFVAQKEEIVFYPTYKSSYTQDGMYKPQDQYDGIICWENDLKDCDKKIIELKDIIPLHNSWK